MLASSLAVTRRRLIRYAAYIRPRLIARLSRGGAVEGLRAVTMRFTKRSLPTFLS